MKVAIESMPRLEIGPYIATSAGLASVEAIDCCAARRSGKSANVAWAERATKAARPNALTGTSTRSRRAASRSSEVVPVSPTPTERAGAARVVMTSPSRACGTGP